MIVSLSNSNYVVSVTANAASGNGAPASDASKDETTTRQSVPRGSSSGAAGSASTGSSSSTAVQQLQKRLKELQKQLQQEQRELAAAQARHYSSDAERTATVMAIQSRIASTSAALQTVAAALVEALRKGGGGVGTLVNATA